MSLTGTGDVSKIRSLVLAGPFRLKQAAKEALQEIDAIVTLCGQMGMRNLRVSPLLATNYDLHNNGTIFESHIVRGKSRDIIAAGGRSVVLSSSAPSRPRLNSSIDV